MQIVSYRDNLHEMSISVFWNETICMSTAWNLYVNSYFLGKKKKRIILSSAEFVHSLLIAKPLHKPVTAFSHDFWDGRKITGYVIAGNLLVAKILIITEYTIS